MQTDSPGFLTIGALSRATGVPVPTLRTWERRYGFPSPLRQASGHRRYAPDQVPRIRMIRDAIARGHRSAQVVTATIEQLQGLLGESERPGNGAHRPSDRPVVDAWLERVKRLEGEALDSSFRAVWNDRGAREFLFACAIPFMREIGERWRRRDLEVMHEHFASERLRDFLTACWRPASDRARGPAALCATLPGEHHALGLHMAALLLALADLRVVFLGVETPPEDIGAAARTTGCCSVVIGTSASADAARTAASLAAVRAAVPPPIYVLVGGAPPPDPPLPGIVWLPRLEELSVWAATLRRGGELNP